MGVLGNLARERFCQELHKLLWAGGKRGPSRTAAYQAAGFETGEEYVADNARKLANKAEIKARLAELADYAGKLAGIDSAWGMVKLRGFVEANLDDYLGAADSNGLRYFDIGSVPRNKLELISELNQEEESEIISKGDDPEFVRVRKVKVKLNDKIAALRLMAEIGGWKAAEKHDVSVHSLEQLINDSGGAK